jgi:CheY-like chemotaxis protein
VLVVDDEPDGREMLRTLLEDCRAEVRAAASGVEALDVLGGWQPDVIVSDIGMPEMDGFSFIEQLRQRSPADGGRIPAVSRWWRTPASPTVPARSTRDSTTTCRSRSNRWSCLP